MASGTIVIVLYKFPILIIIESLNLHYPNPHKFYSMGLQSGLWDAIPFNQLVVERRNRVILFTNKRTLYNEVVKDCKYRNEELNNFIKAIGLDNILKDKEKNSDLLKIMKDYGSFFDEDSQNTKEEGIKQLKEYLVEELGTKINKKKILKMY